MQKASPLHPINNSFQLWLYAAFWLAYLIINVVATQFLKGESFRTGLLLESSFYALGGALFSFAGYRCITYLRTRIASHVYFILLSVLILYMSSLCWAISHHLSWWLVSGDQELIIELSVYPVKAMLFSAITLAAILLLILTESKLLKEIRSESARKSSLDLSNIQELFEAREPAYDENILLPVRNRILPLKIESILLIQANDYYSNVVSSAYDKEILSKHPLKKWELILPKKHFLRIHRSSIVNLNCIEAIEKRDNNTYEVRIKGLEQHVHMSRRYAKAILDKFQP